MAEGKPIDKIRSVNSVFVSRIDTAIDKLIQDRIAKGEKLEHLLGKTGIAGLKLTYQKFKEIFLGDEFAALRAKGAAVQRPLWASTSTKNPHYPDLMYVENVVGRDTVNTMPPPTLDALIEHGKIVPDTVESDLRAATDVMRALQDAKISLFDVTHQLQVEGVTLFSDSFAALLGAIVYKQKLLESGGAERVRLALSASQPVYDSALARLAEADFLKRIWAHDATLWSSDPDAVAIIKKSLGWLDIQQHMLEEVPGLKSFANEARESFGFAVVCGMGGSSLAPDILADTFGNLRWFSAAARAGFDVPATDRGARSADPRPAHDVHHLEQERHDDRAERVLRLLSREGIQAGRLRRSGPQLRRDHRSRHDA